MILFALLPVVSWVILFLIFRQNVEDWRRSLLSAFVGWGCILVLITEFLNHFSWITFPGIALSWFISGSLLAFLYQKYFLRNAQSSIPIRNRIIQKESGNKFTFQINSVVNSSFAWFSIAIIVLIVFPTGVLALVVPPNEPDAMFYHMASVAHWMQNHNVEHYPTHVIHQIELPPLAGFINLHLQILSGGDRLANLVQWFSMIGSVIGVSYIAKQLGAKLKGQILSAVVCATIPLGVLQSSTAQNDYVLAFWLMCFASNVLNGLTHPNTLKTTLETGSSLGLSILTKPMAYIYGFPFYLLFLGSLIRNRGNKIWEPIAFSTLPVLLLNIGHWWRNYTASGSPLGDIGDSHRNALLTLPGFISLLTKNLAINIVIPNQAFNDAVLKLVNLVHKAIGIDPSDPLTTMHNGTFQLPPAFPIGLSEVSASNPLQILLILGSVGLYFGYKRIRSTLLSFYLASVASGFFLLCFLIRWHVSGTRFQLSFIVLFSAFIGTLISAAITYRLLIYSLVFVLFLNALPAVIFSTTKPIFQNRNFALTPLSESALMTPREIQYFNGFPHFRVPYKAATDIVLAYQCQSVGIHMSTGNVLFEYPLWALLTQAKQAKRKIDFQSVNIEKSLIHVKENNHPSRLTPPCAILNPEPVENAALKMSTKDVVYKRVPSPDLVGVYIDENQIDLRSNVDLSLPSNSTLFFFERRKREHRASITYPNSVLYRGKGWSLSEQKGSWTVGSKASLELPFQSVPALGIEFSAKIKNIFLTAEQPQLTVEVWANNKQIEVWSFELGQPLLPQYKFQVSPDLIKLHNPLLLSFRIREFESPSDLSSFSNPNQLGILLNRLKIRPVISTSTGSSIQ